MTPYSLPFREKWQNNKSAFHLKDTNWTLAKFNHEGHSGQCQPLIFFSWALTTYVFLVTNFAAIGVGKLGIRSSHVKISGRSSLENSTDARNVSARHNDGGRERDSNDPARLASSLVHDRIACRCQNCRSARHRCQLVRLNLKNKFTEHYYRAVSDLKPLTKQNFWKILRKIVFAWSI